MAARIAKESRQPFYLFWTPTLYAMRALMDGRFADAEAHLAEAVALVPRAHLAHWTQWYAPNVFALRREDGDLDDAEQALGQALADLPDIHDPERVLSCRAMLALVYLMTGRIDEAQREFNELATDGSRPGAPFACLGNQRRATDSAILPKSVSRSPMSRGRRTLYELLAPYASAKSRLWWHLACCRLGITLPRFAGRDPRTLGRCGPPLRRRVWR